MVATVHFLAMTKTICMSLSLQNVFCTNYSLLLKENILYSQLVYTYVAESSLTVHDIIMSNPLRSGGVSELEIITSYTVVYGGSVCERTTNVNYILIYMYLSIDTSLNRNS